MCTLGMPSLGLNSQPFTTGAQRGRHRADQRRRFRRQAMAEHDQAIGFLALQHQRVAILARLVVLRVAEQHRVAVALRRVLDSLEDEREERVGDVGHGDEQLAGAERAQVLGGGVRGVVEQLDRLHHPAPRVGRDDARLAEHARDGRGGDAGASARPRRCSPSGRSIIPRRTGGGSGRLERAISRLRRSTKLLPRDGASGSVCNRLHGGMQSVSPTDPSRITEECHGSLAACFEPPSPQSC